MLKPGERYFGRVTAASPLQTLTPYFGQTVQFPLTTSLEVKKGDIVALTVPTWAPALALGLGKDHVLEGEPRRRRPATTPRPRARRAT